MLRLVVVALTFALWASPVAAQPLQLPAPTLTARADRCTAHLRSLCQGAGQRAIESDLSCAACGPPPMPADLVDPKRAATGAKLGQDCSPRAAGPLPASCAEAPRLDTIPRP